MADASLSADELEALLSESEPPGPDIPPPGQSLRAVDLVNRPRPVREPIPTLDMVGMRFARGLRQALSGFLRTPLELQEARTVVRSYAAFIEELPARCSVDVLRVRPLQGSAMLAIDAGLVHASVEALFGGDPASATTVAQREFSPTEQRIARRLLEQACEEYRAAWKGVFPLELEPLRSEASPAMARIVGPSEPVLVTRLGLRIGALRSSVVLCVPYAVLDPIRETLYATVQADEGRDERRWLHLLSDRIQAAEVDLVAEFARATATIEELMSLKPGDFIELGLQESITAKVDGVPVFQCRYGVSNGRYAIRIQSYLTAADTPPGGEHDR